MKDKPFWCAHIDCNFIKNTQDKLCCGRLSTPEQHDTDYNTHRLCLDIGELEHVIVDLAVNNTDVYWLMTTLQAIKTDGSVEYLVNGN